MAKLCPVCHGNMKRIYGSSDKALAVDIDNCPKCGGFWFDNQELFLISAEAAKKYDTEIRLSKIPESAPGVVGDRICPNCQIPLVLLKDPELTKILQLDICPKCMGIWLDQGEFLRYKEFQKEKIEKASKADAVQAAKALRKLGQNQKPGSIWQLLGQDVGRPFDPLPDEIYDSEASLDSANQIRGLAAGLEQIIMWLIQSVLGRFKLI
jgi:Zn-finger nucleic acid-binding protein